MRGLRALLKKEAKEQLRTYKMLITVGVFLMFGMGTPVLFHYLPDLLEASGELDMVLPTFTAADVFVSYANNFTAPLGLGLVVVLLLGMGSVSRERERGTAAMTLCKPVGREAFVLAKFLVFASTVVLSLFLGGIACWVYTAFLYGDVNASGFVALNLLVALYLLGVVAVTLLLSCIFRNQLLVGALALVSLILLWVLAAIPGVQAVSPGKMVGWGLDLVYGTSGSAWPTVPANVLLVVVCLVAAGRVLRRKEL